MISFDTNLAVYAANSSLPQHAAARRFFTRIATREDIVVAELMLVELYLKLRNPRIFPQPMEAATAVTWCNRFRNHRKWVLVESAPVMNEVWRLAAKPSFAFRRIVDVRLALTLRHHGVREFATSNVKDFDNLGFARVWDPLEECTSA